MKKQMRILTPLLLGLIVAISVISIRRISDIRNYSKLINYVGIVRGASQRVVKLEMNGHPDDELVGYVEEILNELLTGQGRYGLVLADSEIYRNNLDLLKEHKQEVPGTLSEWEAVCEYFVNCGITPVIANNDISLKTLAIGRGFWQVYQDKRQTEVFDQLNHGRETLSEYLTDGFSIVETFIRRGYLDAEKTLNTKKTSDDLNDFIR